MNKLKKFTPMEFDSIVPVDDLCLAAGLTGLHLTKRKISDIMTLATAWNLLSTLPEMSGL